MAFLLSDSRYTWSYRGLFNALTVPFQLPSRGQSDPNGSSHSEDFFFISYRNILLFISWLCFDFLSFALRGELCNCFYMEILPLFHVTHHSVFCTFQDYFGGCPHVCYSGSPKLPLVQVTQSISLASTAL